jgi:YegS/Rv2252/BmrU family lipid kinase
LKIKIVFIINPIAGGKNKNHFSKVISSHLNASKFEYELIQTESEKHAYELTKAAILNGAEIVVAVGGDGTINEIGSALIGNTCTLAIIPYGSGNGLARSLKIPMNTIQAVKLINQFKTAKIDAAKLNEHYFFNMSGMGFDAHISHVFAKDKNRGLLGYVKATFSELKNYRSKNYKIIIDGKTLEEEAFILSVANSSQYGNEAHIAPRAELQDGLLDLVIVKPFPLYLMPLLALRMFLKTADKSKYLISLQGKSILINRNNNVIHLDGEPKLVTENIQIQILAKAINVIVP